MIKIQLAPAEELENKHWFVPDLTIFVAICLCGFLGVDQHLKNMQDTIIFYKDEKEKLIKNTERLSADLVRYENMNQNIADLENKILSLKSITVSKIEKYKPIILMEHLQSLKPDGVWFESLVDFSDENYIYLKAGAFNHELVAQFMSNLFKIKELEPDSKNLKTLIYFSQISLDKSSLTTAKPESEENQKDSHNNEKITKAFRGAGQNIGSEDEGKSQAVEMSLPGFELYPRFEIKIQYEERKLKPKEEKKIDT